MQLFLKDEGYFDRSHKDGTRKVLRVFKMPREWRVHEKKKEEDTYFFMYYSCVTNCYSSDFICHLKM